MVGFDKPNIENLRQERDVPGLTKELCHEDWRVRSAATYALALMGDARAVEPLIAALRDEHGDVRWNAAHALGRIGDARAVEPLIAALNDQDRHVRWEAAGIAGSLAGGPGLHLLRGAVLGLRWAPEVTTAPYLHPKGNAANLIR